MTDDLFLELCESHGVTDIEKLRRTLRKTKMVEQKSRIVIDMRESFRCTFNEIAYHLGYWDRSGARQAYVYALKICK